MFAKVTKKFKFQMNWFNMFLHFSLLRKLFFTLITEIFDLPMDSIWIFRLPWVVALCSHSLQGYLTFSWILSTCFRLHFVIDLYSQSLQGYLIFSWFLSIWDFRRRCLVAWYSHRLQGYILFSCADSICLFKLPFCWYFLSHKLQENPIANELIWCASPNLFSF